VVLNLVKKKEKKPRESLLRTELSIAINEINDPLPEKYKIRYISWDFSRAAKSESGNVITQMTAIAEQALSDTGFFHSGKRLYSNETIKDHWYHDIVRHDYDETGVGKVQHGVLRSNCIDSLDRTNAAQFVVGKVAMGYQLYALGIISSPEIDFDEKIGEILMYLYQDMGNSLAMQYGGSELAHTMKSYKSKDNRGLGNKPRDMFTSFRRYYSNSFMDNEKQDKINLFLGNYKPWQETTDLWDLETDYYLHMKDPSYSDKMLLYEKWWESSVSQFEAKKIHTRYRLPKAFASRPTSGLRLEAYSSTTLSSFDKILTRAPIVQLEMFPTASTAAHTYYGRRKQLMTIYPTDNIPKSDSESRIDPNWDPKRTSHPNFQLALRQQELQDRVCGPQHNLLSYYSITLNISPASVAIYSSYIDFVNISTPRRILKKQERRQSHKYFGFNDMKETNSPPAPPMITSQSMVQLEKLPVKKRNNRPGIGQSTSGTPVIQKKQNVSPTVKQQYRRSKIYNTDAEAKKQEYIRFFDCQENSTIVSKSNIMYRAKFRNYQQRRNILTLNLTSPSHISNNSLLIYTKACAQQC